MELTSASPALTMVENAIELLRDLTPSRA
jgi:hypothetical protein